MPKTAPTKNNKNKSAAKKAPSNKTVPPPVVEPEAIAVRGARVHNLKGVDVSFPLNQLTVVTGVSGSGKSSLAFDTIYAEGQRRYVESLSAYARQFLERIDKPDVDEISGICPAIAVRQKNQARNPRSTVATQTEIHDYLRLLYGRVGRTYCYNCGALVRRDTPQSVTDEVLQLPEGTRFYVAFSAAAGMAGFEEEALRELTVERFEVGDDDAPPAKKKAPAKKRARKVAKPDPAKARLRVKAHVMSLMQRGFTRLLADGQTIELSSPDDFTRENFDGVSVVVDRLSVNDEVGSRLTDSLETAFRESHGTAEIHTVGADAKVLNFSEAFECKACRIPYLAPEPRLFSFNNPYGACPTCQGFGNVMGLDMNKVVPDRSLSLSEGAIDPFTKPQFEWARAELRKLAKQHGFSMSDPFYQLSKDHQKILLEGDPGSDWRGVRGVFEWLETKKYKLHVRVFIAKYRGYTTCHDCDGGRLRKEARAVKIGGRHMPEVLAMSVSDASSFFDALELSTEEKGIADKLLLEITRRLTFLREVGVEYLTLDRLASTLSGGESQRIQLATHLGSSLVGALYVLDEPSIGLHPRDNQRLIRVMEGLRDLGNTVLVVEHDEEMMRSADRIIDVGPKAGEHGGEIVFQGTVNELLQHEESLTAKYLRGEMKIRIPKRRTPPGARRLKIHAASVHNLKNIDVEIPLGLMTCVTGVSGSGKSTLIHEVLCRGLKQPEDSEDNREVSSSVASVITGREHIGDVVVVDQTPIGRTPRSNPVTYIKVYDAIREVFASTREAEAAKFTAGHFSFNVAGGRCDTCQGDGTVTVEMQFLADVELTCEECGGTRFKPQILDIKYRGKNIHEVLNLTVREALAFFHGVKKIAEKLKVLDEVGLGYLRLGQSATTLSGGEAQRIKLASHLSRGATARTLFVFDEPTTGLHFDDVNKLLNAFYKLLDAGASLVVIEHNLDVIKTADWVIDLGPEGGPGGGSIVGVGTPEDIAKLKDSHTGRFLKDVLEKS